MTANARFNFILIDADRNPERCVVVMCNNNHVISETYEDVATEKSVAAHCTCRKTTVLCVLENYLAER